MFVENTGRPLVDLLHKVRFDRNDRLIFAGDLITKAPKSREVQSAISYHDKVELIEHLKKLLRR